MYFADALTLDAGRPVTGGFVAYRAKAARVGHYEYSGRDVDPENKFGLRDQASVKVARYSEDVHDPKSAHSFIGKPITDDHPRDAVTRDNWRDHARGTVMGAKWEEGGYLAFDLMLTDGAAIDKVAAGKRELSNGYSCDLVHGEFTATDGVACQFKQTNIRGNHVAIVDRGRAGSECAIRDVAPCSDAPRSIFDSLNTQEKPVKTMLIDGLTVDVSNADTAVATIQTLLTARDTAAGKVTTLQADVATKDAKIATLEGEVKTLTDAKPTPQQLRDAAKQFGIVCDKARAMGVTVTDAMDEAAIRKAVVDAKLGTTAAAYTADQYAVAFDALTNGVKLDDTANRVTPIGMPVVLGDGASVRDLIRSQRNAA